MNNPNPYHAPSPRNRAGNTRARNTSGLKPGMRYALLSWTLPIAGITFLYAMIAIGSHTRATVAPIGFVVALAALAAGFPFSILALTHSKGRLAAILQGIAGLVMNLFLIGLLALPFLLSLLFRFRSD